MAALLREELGSKLKISREKKMTKEEFRSVKMKDRVAKNEESIFLRM